MKAYVIEQKGRGVVSDVPVPEPKGDEILIKVMAAGLCGTDSHIFQGEYDASYPRIPGHEFSGVVEKVGENVTYFQKGQRVAADPNIFCEKCEFCKRNVQNFCQDFQAAGVTRDGAFAQYTVVPERCVFDIGDLDFSSAALIEPLGCVVYGQKRARPEIGGSVLIFGVGPIGLLHLQLAKVNGASRVTVVEVKPERLQLALSLGADVTIGVDENGGKPSLKPEGYDLVIDTTGVPKVVEEAIGYVKSGGTLLVFGVCPPDGRVQFSPYEIFRRDLTVIGSFALKKTFGPALEVLRSGAVQVQPLIGEKVTLDDMPDAMERFITGKTKMKVVVYPNGIVD